MERRDAIKLARRVLATLSASLPMRTTRTSQTAGLPFYARSVRLLEAMMVLVDSDAPTGAPALLRTLSENAFAAFYIFVDGNLALGALQRSEYAHRKEFVTSARPNVLVGWDPSALAPGVPTTEPGEADRLGPSDLNRLAVDALRRVGRLDEAASVESLYKHLFTAMSHIGTHSTMSSLLDHRREVDGAVEVGFANFPEDLMAMTLLEAASVVLHLATWAYAVVGLDDSKIQRLRGEVHAVLP